jgi:acetolactate synthase I/II/III large subunit
VTAAYAALQVAWEAGVRRLYTVPGESFLPLMDAAEHQVGIRVVSTRHESGAAFMALAEAQVTGVPAIVSGTRAVGATNLSIGVHSARQDSTPMVAVLGQVQSRFLGREAFQEVDLPAFYRPLVKSAVGVTRADALPEAMERALRIATTGRPGPVMIAVPADLFPAPVGEQRRPAAAGPAPAPRPAEAELDELAAALLAARRPVVLAGGGARRCPREIRDLVERFGLGLYATFRRQDVLANDHPHYLGHLTFSTAPAVLAALAEADVVLVLGSRLDEITTQSYRFPAAGSRVLQVDLDPDVLARQVGSRGIVGEVGATVRGLLERAGGTPPGRDWRAAHEAYLANSTLPAPQAGSPVHPAEIIRAMQEELPADTVLTNDAGNHSAFLHRYWRFTRPGTQIASTAGAMGYAVPAAIGVKIARPDVPVVAVLGDGGFLMTGPELETAVRTGAPVVAVVFRNGLYGTIAMHQARETGRMTAVDIGAVDVAGMARSLGAAAWTVEDAAELRPALREALAAGRPAVVDVACAPDVIAPGLSLDAMLGAR